MFLTCPRDLTQTRSALDFLERLPNYLSEPTAVLDFRQVSFAKPYATLLLAQGIRDFVVARRALGLETSVDTRGIFVGERQSAISYLGHVGFFEYIGIGFGNAPGQASGSETYLPITVITRAELDQRAAGVVLQQAVTQKCRHLASLLFEDESCQDVLEYSFREIVRNVFEHAGADRCTLMAQKYMNDQVEIAIADAGVGIHATLSVVHGYSDPEASVRAALRPGVTRVTGSQAGSPWDNTGFGLFVTSRLGVAAGSFTITSSGISLTVDSASEVVRSAVLNGTAIRLVVSTADAEYFSNRLHRIVEEGERLAALDAGAKKPASLSTRMEENR